MKTGFVRAAILSGVLAFVSMTASAQYSDYRNDYRNDYRSYPQRSLRGEIDHVNRMYAHVRWELRRYGANSHIWREYRHLSREIDRLNFQVNHGYPDRGQLYRETQHIHNELHHIELELRVRESDYYLWR